MKTVQLKSDRKISVWKLLTTGKVSSKELLRELEDGKFYLRPHAVKMIQSEDFEISPRAKQVQLVRVSPRDMGFQKNPSREEYYSRGIENGLNLCSAETGPHLRLTYTEQPKRENLWVAMKPIQFDRFKTPRIFCVMECFGTLSLFDSPTWPTTPVQIDNKMVWTLPE